MRASGVFVLALSAYFANAQDASPERPSLASFLDFELGELANGVPVGWNGRPSGTVFADDKTVHRGRWSARIERDENSPAVNSSLTRIIPLDIQGQTLELRGFIRTENVMDFAGLWMREDGDSLTLGFRSPHNAKGTTDWVEYSTTIPLRNDARQLEFGFQLSGTGKAWVDDLQLLVDGKPISAVPRFERPKTPLDLDHEFDGGSRISLSTVTPAQIQNLATLGKVWGFLKYHHQAVTSGRRHWDYDLFRVLPAILASADRASADAAILDWVDGLGKTDPCVKCAVLNASDLQMRPDVDWITREPLLGKELSNALLEIYRNRPMGKQFYVELDEVEKNPLFHESGYSGVHFPDAGFQLLALYRFWNVIEYWFPYRDVIGEDWDQVLTEFIPRLALAKDINSYRLELLALIARVHDTHSGNSINPPNGACELPIAVRFVENQPVVVATKDERFQLGDVLLELDGKTIASLVAEWTPYYAASNDAALYRRIAEYMPRGTCGEATVRVRREREASEITARRGPPVQQDYPHDLPGDAFRLLFPDVAYLKVSFAKAADSGRYIESAANTKGLVIDIRDNGQGFALGPYLVDHDTPVAYTAGELSNPGAFQWGETTGLLGGKQPQKPRYSGKVVILVDEKTQSDGEFLALMLRAVPGSIVVGSTTAGADGNTSRFPLPGGVTAQISGVGVFYADKRPTQRVGIVPDVTVRPTIAGIRDGRDEVLEVALRQILGPDVQDARIRELSKR